LDGFCWNCYFSLRDDGIYARGDFVLEKSKTGLEKKIVSYWMSDYLYACLLVAFIGSCWASYSHGKSKGIYQENMRVQGLFAASLRTRYSGTVRWLWNAVNGKDNTALMNWDKFWSDQTRDLKQEFIGCVNVVEKHGLSREEMFKYLATDTVNEVMNA